MGADYTLAHRRAFGRPRSVKAELRAPERCARRVNSPLFATRERIAPLPHHVRIITLNVNGIRSSERRGLARWLARAEPWDVVCLQEIRAAHDDVPRSLKAPRTSHAAFLPAERKGYSGVGIYAKREPRIVAGFGCREFDAEGRYLEAHFAELTVISVYLPSGSSGPHRQASKFRFLESFLPHLAELRKRSAKSSCAATGTSRTARSTSRTGAATRRIPVSCPRSARG